MKVQGRCHCGEITYEADVEPGKVNLCHCRDCQMLSYCIPRGHCRTRRGFPYPHRQAA